MFCVISVVTIFQWMLVCLDCIVHDWPQSRRSPMSVTGRPCPPVVLCVPCSSVQLGRARLVLICSARPCASVVLSRRVSSRRRVPRCAPRRARWRCPSLPVLWRGARRTVRMASRRPCITPARLFSTLATSAVCSVTGPHTAVVVGAVTSTDLVQTKPARRHRPTGPQ